jgi:hypothetical protein
VRRVEELAAGRHVVLAGDLDATPDAASIRFLRGLQSLGGTSAYHRDVWEWTHPGDSGHTFTTENPLMTQLTSAASRRSASRGGQRNASACAAAHSANVRGGRPHTSATVGTTTDSSSLPST